MDLLGRKYIIDHCVLYLNKKSKEEAFNTYVTDALNAIANNTGYMVKNGMRMSKRFIDLFVNSDVEIGEQDNEKKAEEIKSRIKQRLKELGERRMAGGSSDTGSTAHA